MLLPAVLLLRRGYAGAVIGGALELAAGGVAGRRIAVVSAVPRSTVRGWLTRFAALADGVRAHFMRWLLWLAPSQAGLGPTAGPVGDAVTAIRICGAAAIAAFPDEEIDDVWQFAASATGGRLLANTSAPFPAPWAGERCGIAAPQPVRGSIEEQAPWKTPVAGRSRCSATPWSARPPTPT